MGITYTTGSAVEELDPAELSDRLASVMESATVWLGGLSEAEAGEVEAAGKWSVKQVVGHLTDSALNNIGRVVRFQIASGQVLPGYEQNAWVNLQHYGERDWAAVMALWVALNQQMIWIVRHIKQGKLANVGTVADGDEITLGFLIEDYIAHIEHHLRDLRS
jgi:hypothetical protein